jgi:hypothetical protein
MGKYAKLFFVVSALIVLVSIALLNRSNHRRSSAQPLKLSAASRELDQDSAPLPSHQRRPAAARDAPAQTNDEWAAYLALKLPREKIEEYLRLHNRNAASLLAAYHASGDADHPAGDIEYLKEAARNFPNDPHVQWTVLSQWNALEASAFPEDKRKWLDALKASSPGNSLANYLSASDYFQNNQPEAAIKELSEASGKSSFGDFAMESFLDEEDLYRASGKSPLEADRAAMASAAVDLLPELAKMKGIAQGVQDLQKQYLSSGDTASVQNLSQMSLGLADRLTGGDSGKLIISQLVAMSIQAISLQQLDQNASYDFLGGETPAQRSQGLKQQRAALGELVQGFDSIVPTLTEAEMVSYGERARIYGEAAAMRWVQQQHAPNH